MCIKLDSKQFLQNCIIHPDSEHFLSKGHFLLSMYNVYMFESTISAMTEQSQGEMSVLILNHLRTFLSS